MVDFIVEHLMFIICWAIAVIVLIILIMQSKNGFMRENGAYPWAGALMFCLEFPFISAMVSQTQSSALFGDIISAFAAGLYTMVAIIINSILLLGIWICVEGCREKDFGKAIVGTIVTTICIAVSVLIIINNDIIMSVISGEVTVGITTVILMVVSIFVLFIILL